MRGVILGAGILLGVMIGQGAAAQGRDAQTIQVVAAGSVETSPETATITYRVRGEGAKPDDATRALADRRTRIEKALASVAGVKLQIRTGDLEITEVRGKECREDSRFDAPRLSTGACAIEGYVAEMEVTVTAMPVDKAGTLTGLAAREGATGAKLASFGILDQRAAHKRAMVAAVANGTAEAEAIAAASGVKLGRLLSASDSEALAMIADKISADDIGMFANLPAPVQIAVAPKPVETSARLVMTFEVVR